MSEACINFRRPNGVLREVCSDPYQGGDPTGLTALEDRVRQLSSTLRTEQVTLPGNATVEFRTPGTLFGMRWPDTHTGTPLPAWRNNIVRLLAPPSAPTTPPPAPTTPPTASQITQPPLHTGPQFTAAELPNLTAASSLRDRLISYLMRATTWADLRDTHDTTRNTNPQTGLFNLMYDQMNGTSHNPTWMSRYDLNSVEAQRWMRGEEPMPILGEEAANSERLNEIEAFLDRAPSAARTERERVRTIRDPILGTWLILGNGERVPAGYEAREHSKLAVAFHNLRSLIELVNTEPATGQRPIVQNLQTLMVGRCRTSSSDRRCSTVVNSTQQSWSPGHEPNQLDYNELTHIAEYTSFFGLQPTYTPPSGSQSGWGQNAMKYTVQMLLVYNAFIQYYNEARGS